MLAQYLGHTKQATRTKTMKIITTRNTIRQFDAKRVCAKVEGTGEGFFGMQPVAISHARSARVARVNLKRFVRDGVVSFNRKGEAVAC